MEGAEGGGTQHEDVERGNGQELMGMENDGRSEMRQDEGGKKSLEVIGARRLRPSLEVVLD